MKIISMIGLILDIIGTTLVFFNTPEVDSRVFLHNKDEPIIKNDKLKRNLSKTGFGIIILGFIIQLISYFI